MWRFMVQTLRWRRRFYRVETHRLKVVTIWRSCGSTAWELLVVIKGSWSWKLHLSGSTDGVKVYGRQVSVKLFFKGSFKNLCKSLIDS